MNQSKYNKFTDAGLPSYEEAIAVSKVTVIANTTTTSDSDSNHQAVQRF